MAETCLKPSAANRENASITPICLLKTVSCIRSITQTLSTEFMNSLSGHPLCLSGRQRRKKGEAGKEANKALNPSSKEEDLLFLFHRFLLRLGINTSLCLAVILPDSTKLLLPQCSLHTGMKHDSCRDTAGPPWWPSVKQGCLEHREPTTVKWSDSWHPQGYLPEPLGKEYYQQWYRNSPTEAG